MAGNTKEKTIEDCNEMQIDEEEASALANTKENLQNGSENSEEFTSEYKAIEKAMNEEKIDSFRAIFNESVKLGANLMSTAQFKMLLQKARTMEDRVPEFLEHLNEFKGSETHRMLLWQCDDNRNKEKAWNVFDPKVFSANLHESGGERGKMHGIVFAKNWIMKLLLYSIQKQNDAELSVENTEYVGFDDFVINSSSHTYCFQFKSKANDDNKFKYDVLFNELNASKRGKRSICNKSNNAMLGRGSSSKYVGKYETKKATSKPSHLDSNLKDNICSLETTANRSNVKSSESTKYEYKSFSAINYFEKFCKGRKQYDKSIKSGRQLSLILFTNRKLDDDMAGILDEVETMPSELIDRSLFDEWPVYKLNPNHIDENEEIKNSFKKVFMTHSDGSNLADFDSTFKYFTETFYIFAGQNSDYDKLTKDIINAIETKYGSQYKHEFFNWFFKDFESWYRPSDSKTKKCETETKRGVIIPAKALREYFNMISSLYKQKNLHNLQYR